MTNSMRKLPARKSLTKLLAPKLLAKTLGVLLLTLAFTAVFAERALAQGGSRVEVGLDYNYVRSNVPPGGCGCFGLNGGSGWVAFKFTRSLGLVGEIASQNASNISTTGADLTLTSYLAGARYNWTHAGRFAPFTQALLGEAHAGGTLAPGNSGLPGSANAFAMTAGGGLDIGLTRRLALRALEADYYLTRFDNGVNDHQNNLRIESGVIFRFGGGH
jgi:outer membrane immunogenic protein